MYGKYPDVAEVLCQNSRGVRVVRDVKNDLRLARQHLKPACQLDVREAQPNVLRRDWNALAQRFKRSKRRRGIDQLVGSAQRGIGERRAPLRASDVAPLLALVARLRCVAEITADQP